MRHVIRACYPSHRSRMMRNLVHKDRQAERMIEKKYSISYIAEKTSRDVEWLEITKEVMEDD